MAKFILTEKEFKDWLRARGDKPAGTYVTCPLKLAAKELKNKTITIGIQVWIQGIHNQDLPKWAQDIIRISDFLGCPLNGWNNIKSSELMKRMSWK